MEGGGDKKMTTEIPNVLFVWVCSCYHFINSDTIDKIMAATTQTNSTRINTHCNACWTATMASILPMKLPVPKNF